MCSCLLTRYWKVKASFALQENVRQMGLLPRARGKPPRKIHELVVVVMVMMSLLRRFGVQGS